jgi:hypothetical protein
MGVLTMIEVMNLVLLDFYILVVFHALSSLSPLESLLPQVYMGTSLIAMSVVLLTLGSYFVVRSKTSVNVTVALVSGVIIPIPIYLYFAEFSEPPFLGWLGPFGFFLFLPGLVSCVSSILILHKKRKETKNVEVPAS